MVGAGSWPINLLRRNSMLYCLRIVNTEVTLTYLKYNPNPKNLGVSFFFVIFQYYGICFTHE